MWKAVAAIFLFISAVGIAQTDDREQRAREVIESRIEYLLQSLEENELDLTALFDQFYYYFDHPLNLNEATPDELRELQLLSDEQIAAFMRYRIQYGNLVSIYELASVEYMTPQTIQMLLPFVRISNQPPPARKLRLRSIAAYGNHELVLRYQEVLPHSLAYTDIDDSTLAAKPNSRYLGSPQRLYARYRFRYSKRISFGVTGEKDPGEEFFRGSQSGGFDFYSAHLMVTDLGPVRKVILGDYNLQFGQGVVGWTNFGFRKSPGRTVDIKRFGQGIRPMTSVAESSFLRGAATTIGWKFLELTLAYSNKKVDGNVQSITDSLSGDEINTFSAFQISGLHRTPGELENKNTVNEEVRTANLELKFEKLRVGTTVLQYLFEPPLQKEARFYQSREFNGSENVNAGFHYEFNLGKFHFYGEEGIGQNGSIGMLNGVVLPLDQRLRMSMVQRHYTTDYQAVYAGAFGERSNTRNESGIYAGVEFLPLSRFTVQAFYDVYSFPWMSYLIDGKGKGEEFSGQVTFDVNRSLQLLALYRNEQRTRNSFSEGDYFNRLGEERRQRLRFQFTAAATRQLRLRTRVEGAFYQKNDEEEEEGFMIYQDINWDSKSGNFGFDLRYAVFNTDDYDTRIYAYENDMRYIFLVPSYYNRGTRTYLNIKYKPAPFATLYLKGAYTFSANTDVFGSGYDTIDGKRKYELRAQAILKF